MIEQDNFAKCLVVGAGWLGSKIAAYLPNTQLSADHIETKKDVLAILDKYQPEVLINFIGIKGTPNVDWCETHKAETYFGNVHIPYLLAEACKERGIKLVHMSSGCVYSGDNNGRGWSEDDEPNFQESYYSHTKMVAERILSDYDNILICRIRIPFDKEPSDSNTLNKLKKYDKIIVVLNSITVVDDFLKTLKGLISGGYQGIFNCVNPQPIDYKELLGIYEKEAGVSLGKEYIRADELDTKAPRSNCILRTDKLKFLGLSLPSTVGSISQMMKEYVANEKGVKLDSDQNIYQSPIMPIDFSSPSHKLLVTGGAGFIGSNFIHYWLKNYPNDKIINLDKLTYAGNLDNLKVLENNPNYKFVKADICDRSDLIDYLVSESDFIVHFAAESHVDRSIESADEFLKTNIDGTYNLLNHALKHNKRFHYISTDEVFGSLPLDSNDKFHEKTLYNPRNPYSASKAAADHITRSFFETHGLPITISNCSNNYGPYQNIEKMIPKAITNLLQGKKVPVYSKGENIRDWVFVEDHCRAIDAIIHKGKIGETYCIGGMTQDISNLDLVHEILSIMNLGEEMIEFVADRPGHDLKYAIDWSKIKNELGYKPQFDFNNYLKTTIGWYRDNEWWWRK